MTTLATPKPETKKEDKISILETYRKLSKEEKKNFRKKATPEELKQLIREQAAAKISAGNKKIQALKAQERKEDTRKLILLGTLFKRLLLESLETLNHTILNIKQEINNINEDIKDEIEEIKKMESEYKGEDIKADTNYRIWSRELTKDKKKLKDTEIILSTLTALKLQIDDHTGKDSAQSNSQDIPGQTQNLDQES